MFDVTIGLYRHFKGAYYFVQGIMHNVDNGRVCCYFNILHPEYGTFVRNIEEWNDNVLDREDNVTGQKHRFEKVRSLSDGTDNMTTEHLIRALSERSDSPLQDLDIKGLNNKVAYSCYAIGFPEYNEKGEFLGINPYLHFDDVESAKEYAEKHNIRKKFGIYKEVYVNVD